MLSGGVPTLLRVCASTLSCEETTAKTNLSEVYHGLWIDAVFEHDARRTVCFTLAFGVGVIVATLERVKGQTDIHEAPKVSLPLIIFDNLTDPFLFVISLRLSAYLSGSLSAVGSSL